MAANPFIAKLYQLAATELSSTENSATSEALLKAFLEYAGDTPDNAEAAKLVEYGTVKQEYLISGSKQTLGLKLKDKPVMLSDIMNVVENCPLPAQVKRQFPDLSAREWAAATRLITVILAALERRVTKAVG